MKSFLSVRTLAALLVLSAVSVGEAHAQASTADARCRRSLPNLQKNTMDASVGEVLFLLVECPKVAAPALQTRWKTPPNDSAFLDRLSRVSQSIQDKRVTGAVLDFVTERRRAVRQRIAGLEVLATHLNPRILPRFAPSAASGLTVVRVDSVSASAKALAVDEPIDAITRAAVRSHLAELAQDPRDPDMAKAIQAMFRVVDRLR